VEEALNARGDIAQELVLYRKDGQGIWVMQHVGVQYENGEIRRHFASFWDIDRRVRAEREVRRSHALLEQRVAMRTRELSRMVDDLRRENEKRRAAEEVLKHTLEDKDILLHQREVLTREVNHRVKNTLQMVSALLTVQAATTTEKAVSDGLQAAIRRLDRLAEIHQLLYESEEAGMAVSLSSYLQFLCDHLILASDLSSEHVALSVDAEEGHWSADEAIPIALIVNEGVTNALKHAFPNNRQGVVTVGLHHVGQNFHELVISDNGVGAHGMKRSGSLGMKLIDTFARQLRGTVHISNETGTRITVRLLHEPAEDPPIAE
jgi:two-component sensor histidine kinase